MTASVIKKENNKYDNGSLCSNCVDEKKQIAKNMKNMSEDEIER